MVLPDDAADREWPFRFGKRLRSALRPLGFRQRLVFVLLIVERIAVGLCDLLLAGALYLLFLLLQGGVPAQHRWWIPKTALSAAVATCVLIVLRVVIDLFSTRSVIGYIQSLYSDLLLRLTRGYGEMQWGRFVERNRSELLKHATHTVIDAAHFYHVYIEMLAAVTVVGIMTVTVVYRNPVAAVGLGAVVILLYGAHRYFLRKKLQLAGSEREDFLRVLQRIMSDMFAGAREIRTYRNQSFFHDRIRAQVQGVGASNMRLALLPQVSRIFADQGVVLLFLIIVIVVELRRGDTRQLLSLLVFYFVLSRRLLPLIGQIALMVGLLEGAHEAFQTIDSELNDCFLHRTLPSEMRLPFGGLVLMLDHVNFSFTRGAPILQKVNLDLRKGERVVLHGASGSGKSSLLNLIAGVLDASTGVVRVDRKSIAYVPQEIALLDDSIRNNLLFGLREKSDAELMSALTVARLDESVCALPLGLETRVGDNGVLFSAGQRQRLGLARALLRDATLLLLDEATSALDRDTECQVLANLKSSGIAVMLVSHRLNTKSFADRIFRLHEGRLIEEFNEKALMSNVEASGHASSTKRPQESIR